MPSDQHLQPDRSPWHMLLPGYLYLAALWLAARQLPHLHAAWSALALPLFALPLLLLLWHQHAVRRLLALHQFDAASGLHRLARRRAFGMLWRAVLALALAAGTLAQAAYLGPQEWLLLGLAPLLLAALAQLTAQAGTVAQFRAPVYRLRWTLWISAWVAALALTAAWLALRLHGASADMHGGLLDQVHALQGRWPQAAGLLAWALDLAAWGQATVDALGHAPGRPAGWQVALALLLGPFALFGQLCLSLAGLSLPATELRRVLGRTLDDGATPAPLDTGRAMGWACVGLLGCAMWFLAAAQVQARLDRAPSPFAITPVPDCEQIDGQFYRPRTTQLLDALLADNRTRMQAQAATACAQLDAIAERAAAGVDAYLDWYFSLGAEWLRIATLLSGDMQALLQSRFQQMVLTDAGLQTALHSLQAAHAAQWEQLGTARVQALELLQDHRLVLDARACRVVQQTTAPAWEAELQATHTRLAAGSAAGLAAGAIAAGWTGRAMGKASVKTAGKVLVQGAARKSAGKGAAAAAGAAAGSAAVPGVGTAVGAATGLAIAVAVDLAMLAAEERLTRADMRRELLATLEETLQPYRQMFGCR